MARTVDWEGRIGRRLRLRDLHILSAVAQAGSMAGAAAHLGVTQPAVSKAIGDLEAAVGVQLFDRSPQGVEPTLYGRALLQCSLTVFDELKQGIRSIEFLSDPTVGELRIGSVESITAATLAPVIQRFYREHPKVLLRVDDVPHRGQELTGLWDRTFDLILLRLETPLAEDSVLGKVTKELNIDILFDDKLVIAAGIESPWARRRKIDIADLVDEPWILTAPGTWNYDRVAEAFSERGLGLPKLSVVTTSVHLRSSLPAGGQFITAYPNSLMQTNANREILKVLPVDLPVRPWPVAIVTLKNRTLSPVVARFIACAREVTGSLQANSLPAAAPPRRRVVRRRTR